MKNYFLLATLLVFSGFFQMSNAFYKVIDNNENDLVIAQSVAKQNQKQKKELRYLYASNSGLIGYFDDGSISSCPRCDFYRDNVLYLFEADVYSYYKATEDGTMMIQNRESIIEPNYIEDRGWKLINYKWQERVPQSFDEIK